MVLDSKFHYFRVQVAAKRRSGKAREKKSLAQEVRQKRDISERRSKG